MTDVHRCDRDAGHDGFVDALFSGQPALTIQTPRGQLELCPACAEEFETWWTPEETPDGETIADNMDTP